MPSPASACRAAWQIRKKPANIATAYHCHTRFEAVLRDLFTQEGEAYLEGWRLFHEIFSVFSIHAAQLDTCFAFSARQSLGGDLALEHKAEFYDLGERVMASLLGAPDAATTPPDTALLDMLFPELTEDTDPYDKLKPVKELEGNKGHALCRFNTLRLLLDETHVRDRKKVEQRAAVIGGVGQLAYQHHFTRIMKGGNWDVAVEGMGRAMNLVRICPGLEDMVLANSLAVRNTRKYQLYCLLDPDALKNDPGAVITVKTEGDRSYAYRYLGGHSFSVSRVGDGSMEDLPIFMAGIRDDEKNPVQKILVSDETTATASAKAALSHFKLLDFKDHGPLTLIYASISLYNLAATRRVVHQRASENILRFLRLSDALVNSAVGVISMGQTFPGLLPFARNVRLSGTHPLMRSAVFLAALVSMATAWRDLENEDAGAAGANVLAATLYLLILAKMRSRAVPTGAKFLLGVFAIKSATLVTLLTLLALGTSVLASRLKSEDAQIALRKGPYAKGKRRRTVSADEDAGGFSAMLKRVYPLEKGKARFSSCPAETWPSYEVLFRHIREVYKDLKVAAPQFMDEIEDRERWRSQIGEIGWNFFASPADAGQVLSEKDSGITLHFEGLGRVSRYYRLKNLWWSAVAMRRASRYKETIRFEAASGRGKETFAILRFDFF